MIWNSIPAKGFHSLAQSCECGHGDGSKNPVDVGLDLYVGWFCSGAVAWQARRAPDACKLTGIAHSEFEKWLLAGDENQSRFVR